MNDSIKGTWRDSAGHENEVSFKASWGEHFFTQEEIRALLQGEEICFAHKGREIRGHLQCCSFNGSEYVGFKPDFDKNYEKEPVFRGSTFRHDMRNEDTMAEFMRRYYYAGLSDEDGTAVAYRRITDKEEQKAGVDVEYVQNGKKYIVDEKAQMDYIYKEKPLPTFALEISGVKGAEGWFVKSGLKTRYYLFIWPHAERKPLSVDNIQYAMYALVEKKALQAAVEKKYGGIEELKAYAHRLMAGELGYEKNNRVYYKASPFDQDGYLVYTKKPTSGQEGKEEEPVNLVVSRRLLQALAQSHGTVGP